MKEGDDMKYPLVSQRITEALFEKEMRAQDLANASGVSKASISQYVNGTNCPSSITAKKLGTILGVSPMWLMGLNFTKEGAPLTPKLADFTPDLEYEAKFGKFIIEARKLEPLKLEEMTRLMEYFNSMNGGDDK